jgi:uncharacterized membrane protein
MSSSGVDPIAPLTERNYEFRLQHYLQRGWLLFKQNWGVYVAFTLLLFVFYLVVALISPQPDAEGFSAGKALRQLISSLLSLLIGVPLVAGLCAGALQHLRGRVPQFSDFFGGFNKYVPLILAHIAVSLLTALGLLLLILPGIYLAVAYWLTVPTVLDRNFNFWSSMEISRRLITRNWFSMLGFLLVFLLINLVGLLACGLGLLVTLPWTACSLVSAYADIVGLEGGLGDPLTDQALS